MTPAYDSTWHTGVIVVSNSGRADHEPSGSQLSKLSVQCLPAILGRAKQANVVAAVLTGTSVGSTRRSADICHRDEGVLLRFTAGVHPHQAKVCRSPGRAAVPSLVPWRGL